MTQGNVTSITQDNLVLMWFGTWDGRNMYDGFQNNTFNDTAYNSSNTRGILINNVLEIDQNYVAIATYSGLSIFNRQSLQFEFYATGEYRQNIRLIHLDSKTIIVTINDAMTKFDVEMKKFQVLHDATSIGWKRMIQQRLIGVNRSEFLLSQLYDLLISIPILFEEISDVCSGLVVNDSI